MRGELAEYEIDLPTNVYGLGDSSPQDLVMNVETCEGTIMTVSFIEAQILKEKKKLIPHKGVY